MTPPLVLLDRDGVLNEDRPESIRSPDQLVMIPGAAEAVARLNAHGVRVALVTNQAIVGRGIISEATLTAIHMRLRDELARAGAWLDAIFYCPDPPERATPRRKPGPGMLLEALERFRAEPARTPMVGDALRDLEAAAAAGCPRILVRTGKGRETERSLTSAVEPVEVFDDLGAAVAALLDDGSAP